MPTDFLGRVMVVFNRYGMSMLQGAGVSLKIALVGTLVGCLIGFAVGIVQTIPSEKGDNPSCIPYYISSILTPVCINITDDQNPCSI